MQRVGARCAAVFLRENGHLVPRVARLADGSTDEEAWEALGDVVDLDGNAWTDAGQISSGGLLYEQFTSGLAKVWVELGMTVT